MPRKFHTNSTADYNFEKPFDGDNRSYILDNHEHITVWSQKTLLPGWSNSTMVCYMVNLSSVLLQ